MLHEDAPYRPSPPVRDVPPVPPAPPVDELAVWSRLNLAPTMPAESTLDERDIWERLNLAPVDHREKVTFPQLTYWASYYVEDHADPTYSGITTYLFVGQGGIQVVVPIDSAVTVTDNGNGTVTYSGAGVTDNGDGTFTLVGSNVVVNNDGTFTVSY